MWAMDLQHRWQQLRHTYGEWKNLFIHAAKLVAHGTLTCVLNKKWKKWHPQLEKNKPCSKMEEKVVCMWFIHINLMSTCLQMIVATNWVWTTWIEYETKLSQTKRNLKRHEGKFQDLVSRSRTYPTNQVNHGCLTGQTYPCSTTFNISASSTMCKSTASIYGRRIAIVHYLKTLDVDFTSRITLDNLEMLLLMCPCNGIRVYTKTFKPKLKYTKLNDQILSQKCLQSCNNNMNLPHTLEGIHCLHIATCQFTIPTSVNQITLMMLAIMLKKIQNAMKINIQS